MTSFSALSVSPYLPVRGDPTRTAKLSRQRTTVESLLHIAEQKVSVSKDMSEIVGHIEKLASDVRKFDNLERSDGG